ncbi:unnamed protein product [Sphagnum compactum]
MWSKPSHIPRMANSMGFGYGAWVGILVASGFRVVPVQAQAWKMAAGIYGREYTKDDSWELASLLFPELSPLLKRKKDHGKIDNSFCDFGNHISDISVPSK